jgi:hypothetical protein
MVVDPDAGREDAADRWGWDAAGWTPMIAKLLIAALVSVVAMLSVSLCRAARRSDDASEAWAKRRALQIVNTK